MNIIIIILLLAIIYLLVAGGRGAQLLPVRFGRRKIILDSCTLIDGRIVELVRTGFVADELVVPKFILSELQMLADGNDSHKRERARFGLEVAAELQEYVWAHVRIDETSFAGIAATDDKLVKLAKKTRGVLCTTDYNLNKVAAVEGVRTLNVNELAQSLRPISLPGENLEVKIIQRGSNADQGVGYMEDGTMIVVDGAARSVGSSISVVVDRMHQTVAGKMVFAHVKSTHTSGNTRARAAGAPSSAKAKPAASARSNMRQQRTTTSTATPRRANAARRIKTGASVQ